jgi:hypothetical protein
VTWAWCASPGLLPLERPTTTMKASTLLAVRPEDPVRRRINRANPNMYGFTSPFRLRPDSFVLHSPDLMRASRIWRRDDEHSSDVGAVTPAGGLPGQHSTSGCAPGKPEPAVFRGDPTWATSARFTSRPRGSCLRRGRRFQSCEWQRIRPVRMTKPDPGPPVLTSGKECTPASDHRRPLSS